MMRSFTQRLREEGGILSTLAALLTTLCCLGVPAVVGLLSALGAGFLLTDRYLAPLLALTLLLAVGSAGLQWRQHRHWRPFTVSLLAAVGVFFALYGLRCSFPNPRWLTEGMQWRKVRHHLMCLLCSHLAFS